MYFNAAQIESKWRNTWNNNQTNAIAKDSDKPKFYILDMFPYPSGSGLHVGHPLGYIASDIYARYKRQSGFNVLHPMGYDAFGLPAEQYAIQTGIHPNISTNENIKRYREQLDNIGFNYDWNRMIKTCDTNYYKWTQWIFIQLFNSYYDNKQDKAVTIDKLIQYFEINGTKNLSAANNYEGQFSADDWMQFTPKEKDEVLMHFRLAYRKVSYVNWCEELGTVLANDEVKNGLSERGGYPVEKKAMRQWSLRITAYSQRLLDGLDKLEWSDSLKAMQQNWIGRSEGAQLFFDIDGHKERMEVFTTRPDTIFGATFMVLAPEHELVDIITSNEQKEKIEEYKTFAASRSDVERMAETKQVSGAFTGAYAINPFNGKKTPIWIAEYVLKDYGTGAIMAVPADDDRDKAFAKKFDIEILPVVDKSKYPGATVSDKVGIMINSDFITGMEVKDAIKSMFDAIEEKGIGAKKINYRLRDAIFSRQRYWGEPIPVYYDADGVTHTVALDNLPVELPELDDYRPSVDGQSPLSKLETWVNPEPNYKRETDTMPGFAGSSWYYLRYMDPTNNGEFVSKKSLDYWENVDLYVGGTEHAVGHLLYSRFWNKFLYDLGYLVKDEPFKKLINQGMIQGILESVYIQKEKENGVSKFICAGLVKEQEAEKFVKIPIHVDFVQEYGTDHSFLNISSIKRFLDWRPEYKDAIFECANGTYQKGQFTPKGQSSDMHLHTVSELGKMSKSKFNVINPDDVISKYGADCFRMYEMFLGPIEQAKPWNTKGIEGVSKFIRKFWSLFYKEGNLIVVDTEASKAELKILHQTIKKITTDIKQFSFNTGVSAFMVAVNELKKIDCHKRAILEPMVQLMAPFAPFLTEELWSVLGHKTSVHHSKFPLFDESMIVEDSIEYPICINGKKRFMASFASNLDNKALEEQAMALEELGKWIEGKTVRKVIVVPKRMINIVV